MRRITVVLTTVLAALLFAQALQGQQKAQFLIPFSDADGNAITTVAPADLTVFEDGKQARVLTIEPRDRPLNVTLSIDNGRMLGETFIQLRTQVQSFFQALPEGVEMSLVSTAPQPRYVVRNSKDREALVKAADRITVDTGPGRFIEGLQDVASTWAKGSRDTNFVLVSFGSTFASEFINKRHLEEAMERLNVARGTVHVVMFRPASGTAGDAQHEIGKRAASVTRGQYHEIGSHLQFPIIPQLAGEIARASGTGRTFLVTIERPEGAKGPLGALSLSPNKGMKAGRITRLP
jgi:hypothetical protein